MLDRIRHLEIVREIATKHEDRNEERGVQGEDEALEGQLLLEPACGRCTVPHLLHVAHLAHLRVQVVLLHVCNMHIHIHEHVHVQYARAICTCHMHVHVHVHIRMCVSQLQQAGSVRDHKHGTSPFRLRPNPFGSSSSQEPSAPKPDVCATPRGVGRLTCQRAVYMLGPSSAPLPSLYLPDIS